MTISLPTVRKKRKSEVLDPNAPEIVRKTATDFANFFSEHYDEFAMEYSILAELKQVAQTVALARWLVDEGIPVPSSLLTEPVENVETPSSTPAIGLDVNKRAGKIFYLVGGVDSCSMEARNHYSRTVQTPNIVASALERQGVEAAFELSDGPIELPANWAGLLRKNFSYRELGRIENSVKRGAPFGDDRWRKMTAVKPKLESTLRPKGRPKKCTGHL